jgi:hypothetical protein
MNDMIGLRLRLREPPGLSPDARVEHVTHCARDGWPAESDDLVRLSKSSH